MPLHRVYLDSNILISALGGDADHALGLRLMAVIGAVSSPPEPPYVTSELTLSEILVRPMRLKLAADISGFDNAVTTSGWLDVEPVGRNILWGAASLRSQHQSLKLPDAIHIATALAKRCSHLLTSDTGLRGRYAMNVAPQAQLHSAQSVEVIRPDDLTLNRLVDWQRS